MLGVSIWVRDGSLLKGERLMCSRLGTCPPSLLTRAKTEERAGRARPTVLPKDLSVH